MVGGLEFFVIFATLINQHRDAAQQAVQEQLGALRVVLVGEAERVRSVGCGGEVGGGGWCSWYHLNFDHLFAPDLFDQLYQ